MNWWHLVPTVLWTAALVFLPGYLAVRCWALTGLAAAAAAAPVSLGLIAGSAVVASWLDLPWHVLVVAGAALALALTGLALRAFAPGALGVHGPRDRHDRRPLRSHWTPLVYAGALLIPALLLTRGLTTMIGAPENISQTYDNIFHLNAVRFILDSGSGSSLTLGGMYSDGADPSLYPGAWHDLVSLVVQVSGASLPAAVNAVTLVVGALVWPLSCLFLVTRVTGVRPVPVAFAGALSATFGAFPYRMVDFGVLYPYFLALAVFPAAIALTATAVGVGHTDGAPRRAAGVLLLTAVTGGLGLAHPSTVLALGVLAVPLLVVAVWRRRPTGHPDGDTVPRFAVRAVLLAAYLAALTLVWLRARPSEEASAWPPVQTIPQAIGQVLSGGIGAQGPSWIVLVLLLVTIAVLPRLRYAWWLVALQAVVAGLFIVVSAVPDTALRDFLTGVWYNDTRRLAGQLPVITAALCAVTATWIFTRYTRRLAEHRPDIGRRLGEPGGNPTPARAGVALVLAAVLGVAGQFSSVNYAVWAGQSNYTMDADAPVLSTAERDLLTRLDETVPEDTTIIGNPWTGTALAYALGERRTLTPHVGGTIPEDAQFLMDNLHRLDTDPRVCETVRELDSHHVLFFAGPQVHGKGIYFEGLKSVAVNPGLTRVDSEGPAAILYRVTGC